ncbi:uncharacterized protein SRS1_15311 [Sporisorium reilianum f. sp. reilianum]|uniref:Uncharacterized protein n=1 Tax=Sporisorium reilianum f. sp. reilianum TaxID=72559 RepID=A0A2N8UJK0_9BASI|nr:uncharacterized protein SRS1_15311 [Sporisorium reilianum f. sp. reilianum]
MEPALPLPLRLDLSFAPAAPIEHATVSDSISLFLSSYAARTGTSNAATTSTEEPSAGASTGGVVAAQLTRLMNGLSGKIDYDAFTSLISNLGQPAADADADEAMHEATPVEVLESTPSRGVEEEEVVDDGEGALSFSKAQELHEAQTPTLDSSLLTQNPLEADSPSKKSKKDKKEKRDKKDRKALKAE